MINIITNLEKIGFTENEAKVYIALLQNPNSSGYEVSKVSGVARAKVYEVLDSLIKKGVAFQDKQDNKSHFKPLQPNMLLDNYLREASKAVSKLEKSLQQQNTDEDYSLTTIKGYKNVWNIISQLIKSSKTRLLISGFPRDLEKLEDLIVQAEKRDVLHHILSYGTVQSSKFNYFKHSVSPLQYLQVAALGRWLAIVIDQNEVVIAQIISEDNTIAFWTKNPAIIFSISGWITHDITLHELEKVVPKDALIDAGPILQELKYMWVLKNDEGPKLELESCDLKEIFTGLQARLKENPPKAIGVVQFVIDNNTYWHILLRMDSVSVEEGRFDNPSLTIKISQSDLTALYYKKLPFSAFNTEGRITVEGDLYLAAFLQGLFY